MARVPASQQELSTEFAVLRVQMTTIEKALGDVVRGMENVARDLAVRNVTPWTNIIAACGVSIALISAIGFLALQPLQTNQTRLTEIVDRMQVAYVPRVENEQHWIDFERRHTEVLDGIKETRQELKDLSAAATDRISKRALYYEALSNSLLTQERPPPQAPPLPTPNAQ